MREWGATTTLHTHSQKKIYMQEKVVRLKGATNEKIIKALKLHSKLF
jgi:hypothetical protein